MSNFGEIYRMLECYFYTIFFFFNWTSTALPSTGEA
jgi:hypothetical protein